jgi:signal transduction histidine kinase
MTIKNTLRFSAIFSIIFSFFIIISVVFAAIRIDSAIQRGRSADAIVRQIFELHSLTDQYLLYPNQRIVTQWRAAYNKINDLLEMQETNNEESRDLISSLRKRSATIGLVFGDGTPLDSMGLPILSEAQSIQLKINSQAMVVDATHLADLNFKEQEESRGMIVTLLIIIPLIFSLSIASIMFTLNRRVTGPLSGLQEGTERIARGDLSFRLNMKGNNEFSEVASSFDEMAKRLEESYKNLNKKVWATEEVVNAHREFIAMLSHELRNPLAILLNAVEIMQYEHRDNKELSGGLVMMDRNINIMRKLIDDLLDVSRVMRGKITLNKERVDLSNIVSEAVAAVRNKVESKMQKIEYLASGHTLMASVDPIRITQVLTNLIDNAIKFTPQKGLIQVNAYSDDSDVIITVKDSGIGIQKEDIGHIFEAFVQTVEANRQKEGHGLGLGLKIAKTIIELHDGIITAKSEGLARGSTFTIRIPLG